MLIISMRDRRSAPVACEVVGTRNSSVSVEALYRVLRGKPIKIVKIAIKDLPFLP